MNSPTGNLIGRLTQGGFDPRPTGPGSWESRCPAHDGSRRNLSVSEGDDGRALLHCHHEPSCPASEIVAKLGLSPRDLFSDDGGGRRSTPKASASKRTHSAPEAALAGLIRKHGEPSAFWTYHHVDKSESFRVYRFDFADPTPEHPDRAGKEYRPIHKTESGWVVGDPEGALPLYRLHDLVDAGQIFVAEGEKAADLIRGLGLTATTSAHGAQSPRRSGWGALAGKSVVILPDHDPAGEKYADRVVKLLAELDPAPTIRIVRLPGVWKTDAEIPEGADAAEWLLEGVPDSWDDRDCRAALLQAAAAAEVVDLDGAPRPEPNDDPGAPNDWGPLRLSEAPEAEPFPVDVLPIPVEAFVREAAESILCPCDYVGTAALAVAGAAIGQSVNVVVKPGWYESPLMYAIVVGDPGTAKTPAIRAATKPLVEVDEALRERSKAERERWEARKKAYDEGSETPPGPEPPRLRAIVKDVTRESLCVMLADNPRGLICTLDEAAAWVNSWNQYRSKGTDEQSWLSVYSGDPVCVDRKGGREDLYVPHPFCSLIGGTQPDMLTRLQEDRGRDNGMLDRLVFSYPSEFPVRRWTEAAVSPEAEADWTEVVRRLASVSMRVDGDKVRPWTAAMTPTAKAEFIEWFNRNGSAMDEPGSRPGALSKSEARLARFALILSRLRLACDPERVLSSAAGVPPIERCDIEGAIRLDAYFASHRERALCQMSRGVGDPSSQALLEWIKRGRKASFREAEAAADLRRFRADPDSLRSAIATLVGLGVIRPTAEPAAQVKRGPKPSPAYEVHPEL